MSWTVLELLRWTTEHFASRGIDTARLDAECLLAHALACDRLRLYVDFEKPVEEAERARFRELVRRRAQERVPVALLTGTREFWSLPLLVSGDVLVPRPETETLVEAALGCVPDRDTEFRALDLGTGSGAVALALAHERPKARVTATDVSEAALAVAAENAKRLGLTERVRFAAGSLFEPVAGERFDLVMSNPPYVAESERDTLPPELAHEPAGALFAGADGLDVLRALIESVVEHLEPDGFVVLEMDPRQVETVCCALQDAGLLGPTVHRDAAQSARVVVARQPGGGA